MSFPSSLLHGVLTSLVPILLILLSHVWLRYNVRKLRWESQVSHQSTRLHFAVKPSSMAQCQTSNQKIQPTSVSGCIMTLHSRPNVLLFGWRRTKYSTRISTDMPWSVSWCYPGINIVLTDWQTDRVYTAYCWVISSDRQPDRLVCRSNCHTNNVLHVSVCRHVSFISVDKCLSVDSRHFQLTLVTDWSLGIITLHCFFFRGRHMFFSRGI